MKKMNFLNLKFSPKLKIGITAGVFTVILVGAGLFYFKQSHHVSSTDKLIGVGSPVKAGQTVVFDYQAFIYDKKSKQPGAVVDSTYARKQTRSLVLGEHQTILGLEKALYGMRVGGQREVIIPAKEAYGSVEVAGGLVPPNSDLFYRIELRAIK